jgi:hypothetical protein
MAGKTNEGRFLVFLHPGYEHVPMAIPELLRHEEWAQENLLPRRLVDPPRQHRQNILLEQEDRTVTRGEARLGDLHFASCDARKHRVCRVIYLDEGRPHDRRSARTQCVALISEQRPSLIDANAL